MLEALNMDRHWLLTSTTYGNWLPGDPRGFVSAIQKPDGEKVIHNVSGTEYDRDLPRLQEFASGMLKGPPVVFNREKADIIFPQLCETADFRGHQLRAVGIMAKHIHLVVGVVGDPDPDRVLGDFKSYASRALNKRFGKPKSETWWTERGSTRKLRDEAAVLAAIEYIRNQVNPLLIWIAGEGIVSERRT